MATAAFLKLPLRMRKDEAGFEADTPQCANCTHYKRAKIKVRDGIPQRTPGRCKELAFDAPATGCCDRWTGKRGEGLAP